MCAQIKKAAAARKQGSASVSSRSSDAKVTSKSSALKKASLKATASELADTSASSSNGPNKAAKRALKRKELLAQAAPGADPLSRGAIASLPPHTLSKSAVKRAKKRAKEQLAGNQAGMQDLGLLLGEVEAEVEEDEAARAERLAKEGKIGAAAAHLPVDAIADGSKASSSGFGAKQRRQVLSHEKARQKAILGDLQKTASPFAALRQHVRNSLAFEQQ